MKRIFFLIAIMLLMIGCTEIQIEEEQETEPTEGYELEKYEISKDSDIGNEVFYSIRLTNFGPEPDYIEANKGDVLKLEIVNEIDHVNENNDVEYSGSSGYNTFERNSRFIIYEYKVDEVLERLGSLDITMTLDKTGTFDFGDDTENIPKGTLVVN